VIDPEARTAIVHRNDGTTTTLSADDELGGENVLPGFAVPLLKILG
jgi:hypothetical protein